MNNQRRGWGLTTQMNLLLMMNYNEMLGHVHSTNDTGMLHVNAVVPPSVLFPPAPLSPRVPTHHQKHHHHHTHTQRERKEPPHYLA
jgi:hypothetical protein